MVSIDDLVTNNHKKSALYEVWNGQKLMIGSLVFTLGDNVIAILEFSVWGIRKWIGSDFWHTKLNLKVKSQ